MRNNIRSSLDELKTTDVYSLIFFALYKMRDLPEYSSLSELVYLMDKDSLFNFLECFGGTTIRVPTVKELKMIIYALLVYQCVNIDGMTIEQAIKELGTKEFQNKDILRVYADVYSTLKEYDFKRN